MSMRKIREVLRLTHELGLSVRQVREATGVGKTAVSEYVSRARVIGITWPIAPENVHNRPQAGTDGRVKMPAWGESCRQHRRSVTVPGEGRPTQLQHRRQTADGEMAEEPDR
jgi:hypothetical protein